MISLGVLLAALAVYFWIPECAPPMPQVQEFSVPVTSAPPAEALPDPQPLSLVAVPVIVPVAEPEPRRPVQAVEERGDAMLFEVESLSGTPFDQAVVMPFE